MRGAGHSSRGVVPTVVLPECDREASIIRSPWPTRGCCAMGKKLSLFYVILVLTKNVSDNVCT